MPPLVNDNVSTPSTGRAANYLFLSPVSRANGGTYNNGNIGDDSHGIVRLRRVWDSWSTDYSQAPRTGVASLQRRLPGQATRSRRRSIRRIRRRTRPRSADPIQIRVVDPTNQRIKSLTIRQDFTDKL